MRPTLVAILLSSGFAAAQNTYHVPDPNSAVGTCNSIPLAQTSSIYQTIVMASDLGGFPELITGLGFAPCGAGVHHYDTFEVIMDNTPLATLSTTFASNLSPVAQTVMSVTNHDWQVAQDTWNEIGLQVPFVYDGTSNLVIQLILTGHTWSGSGSASSHRDTRQRVYSNGWATTPPVSGSTSSAGLKLELSMLAGRASTFGAGCVGSNGLAPHASYSGTPMIGQTNSIQLTDAPGNTAAFLILGFGNGTPFPFELSNFGMPGCHQYFGPAANLLSFTDPAGASATQLVIPNNPALGGVLLFGQWAPIDPPANTAGITTSDYVRVLVGL